MSIDVAVFGCFEPGGDHMHHGPDVPWRDVDGALTWNGAETPPHAQLQGDASLRYQDGWTCLAWWDRSGDCRQGSNTALFARGTFSFEEMQALLRLEFPWLAERQPTRLKLRLCAHA